MKAKNRSTRADLSREGALLTEEMVDKLRRASAQDISDAIDAGDLPINGMRQSGWSALHVAIDSCREDVVRVLLAKGALINVADRRGETPLLAAMDTMSIEGVHELLKYGANACASDAHGRTAHHRSQNGDATDLLMAFGADVDAVNAKGETALWEASKRGDYKQVLSLLNAGAKTEIASKLGSTPLQVAVAENEASVAMALIAHGASSDEITDASLHGLPPLHAAAFLGLVPRVIALLKEGRDPHLVFNERSAFDEAHGGGRRDVTAVLHAWQAERAMNQILDASSSHRSSAKHSHA